VIQLPRSRNLTGIALAIFDDSERSPAGSVACPASIEVTDGDGNVLADVSEFVSSCLPNDRNIIIFDDVVEVDTVNINFTTQDSFAIGVCEVEMWIPANSGPYYWAVDAAAMVNADVVFDSKSHATSNGAVLALESSDSEVDFSGIYSASSGEVTLRLDYKNNGTSARTLGVAVNQIAVQSVSLQRTKSAGYRGVQVKNVKLERGLNFVTLTGGGDGVFLEGLEVI
jgi:hypothetical protein